MEANYIHKDSLTAGEPVELKKNNELPISYNQVLLKENQELKDKIERIREIVENSDWRLDDVHDLIDGYDEIAKIII